MKCAILQPSYIPWRGYFHQVREVDVFVFYDDVQFTRRDWRNRNRIKTRQGPQWLTIPVMAPGHVSLGLPIHQVRIAWDRPWNRKHLEALRHAYGRAPFFDRYRGLLEDFYGRRPALLADFTIEFSIALARESGISSTQFLRASQLPARGTSTERLLSILEHLWVDHYLTGPSAQAYLQEEQLTRAGIRVEYVRHEYPEYPQLYPPYDPHVTILDLLFMVGPQAGDYLG